MWLKYKLSEIGTIVGGATPSTNVEAYYNGDIPWLTPKDLSDFQCRYVKKGKRNITRYGLNSCSAQLLPAGSVLFSSRAPIGYIAIAKNPIATNQGFKSIIPDKEKVDSLFLYYLLKYNKNNIEALGSGTTFKEVSGFTMRNIEVFIPSLKVQKQIAGILGSLDDKIELNRRINENLEQQAQALFQSWFVDFEPFKDGKFVDSELGRIPEGWKVGLISDFGKVICGKTPSKASKDYYGGNIPFIKIPDMHDQLFILHSADSLSYKGSSSQQNKLLPPYSLLVSCIATVGLVSINTKPSHTNQQINSIVPYNSSYLFYLYLSLTSIKKKLENMGRGGTATLNVNTTSFSKILIIIPKQSVLDKFSSIISPLFKNIEILSEQNFKISQLRDTLIPRLMSGELQINDDNMTYNNNFK
ncbi:restriction endonuclease subunit S [Prevotella sp. HCN-7019]|uniref:restriction endonuclease subunit S n=1 Tax=Prevotella sp. HCN-7019 TaxID=3134668 RepID=UPI0030BD2887